LSYTFDHEGKALVQTCEGVSLPLDSTFDSVNEFVHGPDVQFEELQALCLGLAAELENRGEFICRKCGLRQDSTYPEPEHSF